MQNTSGQNSDRDMAKYALYAVLVFCGFELLFMLMDQHYTNAFAYFIALVSGLGIARNPPRLANEIRLLLFLGLVWLACLGAAYFDRIASEGIALLLVSGFVVFRGMRSLWFALTMLVLLFAIQISKLESFQDGLSLLRTAAYLLAMTLLVFVVARHLLSARKEALNNSRSDSTTGAGNRAALVEELNELLELYRRYRVEATAVSVRLSEWGKVLEQLGDQKVDQLLIELVNIWQTRIRNTDRLYRYADDCFVFLLPGTSPSSAESLLNDLKHASSSYEFTHVEQAELEFKVESNVEHASWEDWLAALVRSHEASLSSND